MQRSETSSLVTSNLNPFLLAEVGTELNGTGLTIFSILARLGLDPWAEAARLASLPKAAASGWLAERIVEMPLVEQARVVAPATASRLVALLPRTGGNVTIAGHKVATGEGSGAEKPQWVWFAMAFIVIALGLVASLGNNLSQLPTTPSSIGQQSQPQAHDTAAEPSGQ